MFEHRGKGFDFKYDTNPSVSPSPFPVVIEERKRKNPVLDRLYDEFPRNRSSRSKFRRIANDTVIICGQSRCPLGDLQTPSG